MDATALGLVVFALPEPALAAGSGMPWEAPLQTILESIEGPVAKIVAVIIIIVTGLTLAFRRQFGRFRRLVQIVFGLSIAFAASSFFLSFFVLSGGGALHLMENPTDIPGYFAPVHRALIDPILLAGAPRSDRHCQWPRSLAANRARPAALARGPRILAGRPPPRSLGREARRTDR